MLAWEMGTGKTRSTLESIARSDARQIIIVAPLAVCPVWSDQIDIHAPQLASSHRVVDLSRVHGARRKAESLAGARTTNCIVVVNYESVWRATLSAIVSAQPWDVVVLDESHRIKAPGGAASRFLRTVCWRAKRRIALTGTPMPHSPMDLWAQFLAIAPGVLPRTAAEFRARYAIMGGYRVDGRPSEVVGWKDLDELEARFLTVADRVRADDVLDLPDVIHENCPVDLPPSARRAYAQMEKEFQTEIGEGTVTAANGAVKLLRLQQIASGAANDEDGVSRVAHDVKKRRLADLLADLPPSEPVAVFCRFRSTIAAVLDAATEAGRPQDEISGTRKTFGSKWTPHPGSVCAVQIQAGGLGIDLTAARRAVWMEHPLSLGDYEQCLARIRRPGQAARSVEYHHIMANGTVDHAIRGALGEKKNVVAAVIDGMARKTGRKSWIRNSK